MSEQLEARLRLALAERAEAVPTHVIASRLRELDYRPRSPRLRPALTAGGLTAAGAAGAAAALLGLGASVQSAFAGWSAAPTTPAAGQLAEAEASCLARLPSSSDRQRDEESGTAQAPAIESLLRIAPDEWHVVLSDTRGPFTLIAIEAGDGKAQASCFANGSAPALVALSSIGASGSPSPGAGEVLTLSSGSMETDAEGNHFTTIEGAVGAGVDAVAVVLEDGQEIIATSGNGRFLAWWPGEENAIAIHVTTESGVTTQGLSPRAGK